MRWLAVPFAFALAFSTACELPNLEGGPCVESRPTVREFYSFHFGNEMAFSPENLKARERFLSPELAAQLGSTAAGIDPFTTGTDNFPRAFRVGECKEIAAGRTSFEVLVFWRSDVETRQVPITVETAKIGDKWLIDRVISTK